MNVLAGVIAEVKVQGNLSLVHVMSGTLRFTAIATDTPDSAPYLTEGQEVKVLFKESEVIVGKGYDHQISLQNKFPGYIVAIHAGEILCKVSISTAAGLVNSIITCNAVQQLSLIVGSEVTAMIKTNEMMLSE